MERTHQKYDQLIARAKALTPVACAVAHPCDESSLRGAVEAAQLGILKPILVGPKARIAAVAAQFKLNVRPTRWSMRPTAKARPRRRFGWRARARPRS